MLQEVLFLSPQLGHELLKFIGKRPIKSSIPEADSARGPYVVDFIGGKVLKAAVQDDTYQLKNIDTHSFENDHPHEN